MKLSQMSAKQRAARVAVLSRQPGTRAKVPTKYLSAQHRKARAANSKTREANRLLDDPNALVTDLTPRLLAQEVEAQTKLRYQPAERVLGAQMQGSQQMLERNIPSWFAEYQAALANATRNTGAAYQAAAGMQQQTAQSSSALDASQQAAQSQQMQADAAQRGATVDPALAAQSQQAAAARRSMLDQYSALTARQGATEVGYGINRQVTGAAQKLTAQQQEAQRMRDIGQKGAELAADKGTFAAAARGELLSAEHTKRLERQAFGLDVTKAASDASAAAAKLTASQAKTSADIDIRRGVDPVTGKRIVKPKTASDRKTEADLAFFREHGYYPPTGPPKSGKKLATPDQHTSIRKDIDEAEGWIRKLEPNMRVAKNPAAEARKQAEAKEAGQKYVMRLEDSRRATSTEVRQALLLGTPPGARAYSKRAINAAYDLVKNKGLTKANVEALHRDGYSIKQLGLGTTKGKRPKAKAKRKAHAGLLGGAQGVVPSGAIGIASGQRPASTIRKTKPR